MRVKWSELTGKPADDSDGTFLGDEAVASTASSTRITNPDKEKKNLRRSKSDDLDGENMGVEAEEEDEDPVYVDDEEELEPNREEEEEEEQVASQSQQTQVTFQEEREDPLNKDVLERRNWARQMRLVFTPSEMLRSDGSLNEEYFRPVLDLGPGANAAPKQWGADEQNKLIQGLETYGVGEWSKIRSEWLPDWTDVQLRDRTKRVLGRQSLALYSGWKLDATAVSAEFALNKKIGQELNAWKGGMLVADDDGKVVARIQRENAERSTQSVEPPLAKRIKTIRQDA